MSVINFLEKKAYKTIEKVLKKDKEFEAIHRTINPVSVSPNSKSIFELTDVFGPRVTDGIQRDNILMFFGGRVNPNEPQEIFINEIADMFGKKKGLSPSGEVRISKHNWDGKNWSKENKSKDLDLLSKIFFADGSTI